jgi:ComF family protein
VSSGILDVVFPRQCVQCGAAGEWVCPACFDAIHLMAEPLCECCGREVGAGNRCQECARARPRIDGIRAFSRYEGAIRHAIHRLKYGGQRAMAEPLAAYLLPVAGSLPGLQTIVPLPLHPRRERERGYNQSRLLADALGRQLGLPVVTAAQRVRDTKDQIGLDRAARQANVKGAFACHQPDRVQGKTLLLVDDVCTTGSSLLACAAPLFEAGAAAVWGLAIARQDYERT